VFNLLKNKEVDIETLPKMFEPTVKKLTFSNLSLNQNQKLKDLYKKQKSKILEKINIE